MDYPKIFWTWSTITPSDKYLPRVVVLYIETIRVPIPAVTIHFGTNNQESEAPIAAVDKILEPVTVAEKRPDAFVDQVRTDTALEAITLNQLDTTERGQVITNACLQGEVPFELRNCVEFTIQLVQQIFHSTSSKILFFSIAIERLRPFFSQRDSFQSLLLTTTPINYVPSFTKGRQLNTIQTTNDLSDDAVHKNSLQKSTIGVQQIAIRGPWPLMDWIKTRTACLLSLFLNLQTLYLEDMNTTPSYYPIGIYQARRNRNREFQDGFVRQIRTFYEEGYIKKFKTPVDVKVPNVEFLSNQQLRKMAAREEACFSTIDTIGNVCDEDCFAQ